MDFMETSLRQNKKSFWKWGGNVEIYRGYYMPARGYEFYLLVFNSISHEWAQRTSEISYYRFSCQVGLQKKPMSCNTYHQSLNRFFQHNPIYHKVRYSSFYHEKINFISTSGHVLFCLIYKHTNNDVFDDFSKISDHFPKITEDFQNCSEGLTNFSEGSRRFPRRDRWCFDHTTTDLSTFLKIM